MAKGRRNKNKGKEGTKQKEGTLEAEKMNTELISLLPQYSGQEGENLEEFLAQFENIAELSGWEDNERGLILKTRLRGEAFKHILESEKSKNNDINSIKAELCKKFTKKKTQQQKKQLFDNIKHTPKMSIEEVGKVIKMRTKDYLGITKETPETKKIENTVMLQKFLETIREDIAIEIKKLDITTFEEAVKKAQQLNDVYETVTVNNITKTEENNISEIVKNLEIMKLREEMQEIKDNLKKLTQIQVQKVIQCEICKKFGHEKQDCWFRETGPHFHNIHRNRQYTPLQHNNTTQHNRGEYSNIPERKPHEYRNSVGQRGNFRNKFNNARRNLN